MAGRNAAAKRKPNGWRKWFAHCSGCQWTHLDCVSKEDAQAKAFEHNRGQVAA